MFNIIVVKSQKVRSASRVYRRFYWLDEEKRELKWEPSKKDSDKARVRLTDIHEVRSGKNSEVFLSVDTAEHFPEECAFSIVYGLVDVSFRSNTFRVTSGHRPQ